MWKFIFGLPVIFFLEKNCAGQLLNKSFHTERDRMVAVIQPVLHPERPQQLEYCMGVRQAIKGKYIHHIIELQTIEQSRLTGITYSSKPEHVHVNQFLSINLKGSSHAGRQRQIVVKNEQFWSRSTSQADLIITSAGINYFTSRNLVGIHLESQRERLTSSFTINQKEIQGQYSNWIIEVPVMRKFTHSFTVQNNFIAGKHFNSYRFTNRVTQKLILNSTTQFSLDVEYNKMADFKISGFYFIFNASMGWAKGITSNWITVYNQHGGYMGTFFGVELSRRQYHIRLEYRELRNEELKMMTTGSPLFASNILLKIDYVINPLRHSSNLASR